MTGAMRSVLVGGNDCKRVLMGDDGWWVVVDDVTMSDE
jgi:hypothetical protein